MSESIRAGTNDTLTVAQAVLTDDAELVAASTEDMGNHALDEWVGE
jgi:hypothetical protein